MDIHFFANFTLKLLLSLVILLLYMRLSGKSNLAPMSAFDQIGNMVLGALTGGFLVTTNYSALQSCSILAIWSAVMLLIRLLRSHSMVAKILIDGRRVQLMKNGKILSGNFARCNLTSGDFCVILRQRGINSVDEVSDAWWEPSGQLSFDMKGDEHMALPLIENGNINVESLERLHRDADWLNQELERQGYSSSSEVFLCEWFQKSLHFYPYDTAAK